jgi:hypothetical protein
LLTFWRDLVANAGPVEISELKIAVSQIRAGQWRIVTIEQREKFASRIYAHKSIGIQINFYTISIDLEQEGYARSLAQMFRDNGIPSTRGVIDPRTFAPVSRSGLDLVVQDPNNLSDEIKVIHDALEYAEIKHSLSRAQSGLSCFIVGSKPSV